MKKLFILMIVLLSVLFVSNTVQAMPEKDVWHIQELTMEVSPQQDQEALEFKETLKTYFDPDIIAKYNIEKHGIFRYIPYYLPMDNKIFTFEYFMSDWEVTDGQGNDRMYTRRDRKDLNSYFLKIGDPNKTIQGAQIYNIAYTVANPWRYFEEHDEFYWNVVGNQVEVPVKEAKLIFDITALDLNKEDLDYTCFTGKVGSTESDCEGYWHNSGDYFIVKTTRELKASEGFTVAISLPKGIVGQPGFVSKISRFMQTNFFLFLILAGILLLFLVWYKWGKDKKINKPLVVEYKPADKLPPALAAYLLRLGFNNKDLTAEIVYLAVHKYIKIIDKEVESLILKINSTEYSLKLVKPLSECLADPKLYDYQKVLLEKLFEEKDEIKIKDLKNDFYVHIPKIKKEMIKYLKDNGYIKHTPTKRRVLFGLFALGLFFLMLIIIYPQVPYYSMLVASLLLWLIYPLICVLLLKFMPRLDLEKGRETRWELRGLEHYLKTAEAERFKFGELTDLFEKLLPYAISMGLIYKWAEIMKKIYQEPPEWYESDKAFNTAVFARSMTNMTKDFSKTVGSRPSSSSSGGSGFSGGSSGGGGGGGGAGSW